MFKVTTTKVDELWFEVELTVLEISVELFITFLSVVGWSSGEKDSVIDDNPSEAELKLELYKEVEFSSETLNGGEVSIVVP